MVVFRKLLSPETPLYLEHMLRLDAESRYLRFGGTVCDEAVQRYYEGIDWRDSSLIGFFRDGVLRGAVELRYQRTPLGRRAELAFSVERPFQNSGVGTTLMRRALIILSNRGVVRADVVCLLRNRRMQRIVLRHRCSYYSDGGDAFMDLEVPAISPATLLAEYLEDTQGIVAATVDTTLVLFSVMIERSARASLLNR